MCASCPSLHAGCGTASCGNGRALLFIMRCLLDLLVWYLADAWLCTCGLVLRFNGNGRTDWMMQDQAYLSRRRLRTSKREGQCRSSEPSVALMLSLKPAHPLISEEHNFQSTSLNINEKGALIKRAAKPPRSISQSESQQPLAFFPVNGHRHPDTPFPSSPACSRTTSATDSIPQSRPTQVLTVTAVISSSAHSEMSSLAPFEYINATSTNIWFERADKHKTLIPSLERSRSLKTPIGLCEC